MTKPPPSFEPHQLRLTRDLRRLGLDPRSEHVRVRRGVWVPRTVWAGLKPDLRHAVLVHATNLLLVGDEPPTFWGPSAAAAWLMPRIGAWPTVCHTLVEGRRGGSELVRTHRGPAVEPVTLAGVRVTPPARTVIDLARTDSLETAVAAADHALRQPLCTRKDLMDELAAIPPRTAGRRRAQLVVDLADPASMSAGESLSRVRMFQLNLPRPRLQVEHRDERGLIGVVDFDWDGVIGEFDGKLKYAVPEGADAKLAGEVVWREKQREDRLRRTGPKVARWVWANALSPSGILPMLAAQGIRPQARNMWFDTSPAA